MKSHTPVPARDYSQFSEEDYNAIREHILLSSPRRSKADPLRDVNLKGYHGAIICNDCKLFPVYGEPKAGEEDPHLSFAVFAPDCPQTERLNFLRKDSLFRQFPEPMRISCDDLAAMNYDLFRKSFGERFRAYLAEAATFGKLSEGFIGQDTRFFNNRKNFTNEQDIWLADAQIPEQVAELVDVTLEEKLHFLQQQQNEKSIREAFPNGAMDLEDAIVSDSWLDFCKKHDYAICCYPETSDFYLEADSPDVIPNAYFIDCASKWDLAAFLPQGVGDNIAMASAEGLRTIDDMDGLYPGIYIDTKENRQVISDILEREPERRMDSGKNHFDLEAVVKHYPDHPYAKRVREGQATIKPSMQGTRAEREKAQNAAKRKLVDAIRDYRAEMVKHGASMMKIKKGVHEATQTALLRPQKVF